MFVISKITIALGMDLKYIENLKPSLWILFFVISISGLQLLIKIFTGFYLAELLLNYSISLI